MPMLAAVLDVNVLISSVLASLGIPRRIFDAWRQGRFVVKIADVMLVELEQKLRTSRIARRYHLTDEEIAAMLGLLRAEAERVTLSPEDLLVVTGDPEDDGVLATCRLGRVGYLVTGDYGLLDLHEYSGVGIVSPRQFLEILNQLSEDIPPP